MALIFTSNQGIRIPDANEYVRNIPAAMAASVTDIEKLLVQVFDSVADRGTKVPAPMEGMLCWLRDVDRLEVFDGVQWRRVYPTSPAIKSGTAAPTSTGQDGDIYIQYT